MQEPFENQKRGFPIPKTSMQTPINETIEYSTSSTIESSENEYALPTEQRSFKKMACDSCWQSTKLAFSFSFSFMVFSLGFMIASYGDDYLAAIPIVSVFIQAATLIFLSPLLVFTPMSSEIFGKRGKGQDKQTQTYTEDESKELRGFFRSGLLYTTLIVAIPMGLFFTSEFLLTQWFGQNPEIAHRAAEILRSYSLAPLGVGIRVLTEQFLIGNRHVGIATLVSFPLYALATILAIINTIYDPLKLGIKGLALYYVGESWLTALVYCGFLAFHGHYRSLELFNPFKRSTDFLKSYGQFFINSIALPFGFFFEIGSIFALIMIAGLISEEAQGALAFTSQLYFVGITLMMAFGIYNKSEQSRLLKDSSKEQAAPFSRAGLSVSSFILLLLGAVPAIAPTFFARILSVDPSSETFKIARFGLFFKAIELLVDNARFHFTQSLQSEHDFQVPTLIYSAFLSISVALLAFYVLFFENFDPNLATHGLFILPLIAITLSMLSILPRWIAKTQIIENHPNIEEISDDNAFDTRTEEKTTCCFPFWNKAEEQSDFNAPPYGTFGTN